MSSWLFNIFFDRVVKQVNVMPTGRRGKLREGNREGWGIKQVLYADGTELVVGTREHLRHTVNELERT